MTGMDKKKEYSAATKREVPRIIAPIIVAPEREVPGIRASTWKHPIITAILYVKSDNSRAIHCYSKIGFITSGSGLTEEDIHMNYKNK